MLGFLFFAIAGVAHEVFWTGILDYISGRNIRLIGHSTLWMFPIYGMIFYIVVLVQWLYGDYNWVFRGFMYMGLILIWEYFSGLGIRKLVGKSPWDYSKRTKDGVGNPMKYQLNGLVCLKYAPIWFVEGLFAEWVVLWLFL